MKRVMLALIWLVSIGLIALNFWRYPVGNGRDEIYHLQLIDFYAREWRFTHLPDDWEVSSTQAHQPPLYHVTLAAAVDLFLPALGRLENFRLNPYMVYAPDRYDPTIPRYNRVVYVHHHPGQRTPYMTTIRVLQGFSIFINLLGVFFVWRTTRVLPGEPWLSPLALAFLTMTPMFWRRAMGVNNDQFIFLFAAVVTWLLAKTLHNGLRWRLSLGIAFVLGLGLLTKIYMFPLVVTTAAVFGWLARRYGRKALLHLLAIGIVTGLLSGWWYVRNYHLYGDFTASNISEEKLNTARSEPLTVQEFFEILLEWPGESWLEYDVILPITRPALWLASGIGILLTLSAGRRLTFPGSGVLLFGALIPALALAVIGQAENTHGNYSPPIMLSALPATSLLFALGVPSSARAAISAILLILIGTTVYHATVFEPLYPPIRVVEDASDLEVENRVQVDFENGARLVGYEFDRQVVEPGEVVRVKLCWEALDNLNPQPLFVVTTALILPDTPNAAVMEGYPVSGRYPVSAWRPGTAFCEWIPLRIEENAATPRVYHLSVNISEEQRSTYLALGNLAVVSPVKNPPETAAQVDDWGALVSYSAHLEAGTFTLTLDWLTLKNAPGDYHYFLHVLDQDGGFLMGSDPQPLEGKYPTTFWQPKTRFQETLVLDHVPPEAAMFRFGMYRNDRRGQWTVDGKKVGDGLLVYP